MIYLDTHLAAWLYFGEFDRISSKARELIEDQDLYVSPIVQLELQYLLEINKIKVEPVKIIKTLEENIGLKICLKKFDVIIQESLKYQWTRDPFDRIITANAAVNGSILVTKDKTILKHYKQAVW